MQRYKFFEDYQIFSETFFKKPVFIAPNHHFSIKKGETFVPYTPFFVILPKTYQTYLYELLSLDSTCVDVALLYVRPCAAHP